MRATGSAALPAGQQPEGRICGQAAVFRNAAFVGHAGELDFDRSDYRLVSFRVELAVDMAHPRSLVEPMLPRRPGLPQFRVAQAGITMNPFRLPANLLGKHVDR